MSEGFGYTDWNEEIFLINWSVSSFVEEIDSGEAEEDVNKEEEEVGEDGKEEFSSSKFFLNERFLFFIELFNEK